MTTEIQLAQQHEALPQALAAPEVANAMSVIPHPSELVLVQARGKKSPNAFAYDPTTEQFIRQVTDHPLLTSEQEKILGTHIQRAKAVQKRLGDVTQVSDHDAALLEVGREAKDLFIDSNRRLVVKEVNGYLRFNPVARHIGFMDLFQEGYLALDRAVKGFDPTRKFRFSTFAVPIIRNQFTEALSEKYAYSHISFPYNRRAQIRELRHAETMKMADDELMETLQLDHDQLSGLRADALLKNANISFDQPLTDEEGFTQHDLVPDKQPTDGSAENVTAAYLVQVLSGYLTKRDQQFLIQVVNDEPLTETDMRRRLRLRSLFSHPSIYAEVKGLTGNDSDPDWRDEAACIGSPDLFIGSHNQIRKEVGEICGSCAVRSQCLAYFNEKRPEKGRWAGGHTAASSRAKRTQKARLDA